MCGFSNSRCSRVKCVVDDCLAVWSTVLFFVVILFVPLQAKGTETQEEESIQASKHSLGIGAGFTTGLGLSYRYLPEDFGVQLNFAPLRVDERETIISLGFTFLYKLMEAERTSLYIYQGNHFIYENWKGVPDYPYWDDPSTHWSIFNGIGMGMELIILQNIGYNIMFGYASYDTFARLGLTVETGIYYKF